MRRFTYVLLALLVMSTALTGCGNAAASEEHPAVGRWSLVDQSGHDVVVLDVAADGTLQVGEWSPGALSPDTTYDYTVVDRDTIAVSAAGSEITYRADADGLAVSIDGEDFGVLDRAVDQGQN